MFFQYVYFCPTPPTVPYASASSSHEFKCCFENMFFQYVYFCPTPPTPQTSQNDFLICLEKQKNEKTYEFSKNENLKLIFQKRCASKFATWNGA